MDDNNKIDFSQFQRLLNNGELKLKDGLNAKWDANRHVDYIECIHKHEGQSVEIYLNEQFVDVYINTGRSRTKHIQFKKIKAQ
ncbi:MAG: hypothetical protein IJ887_00290 [Prevotella sp.]|nr:hypothetical protein [Prevotella sp.]MBR6188398.1 hypothetical protein [Prevotella sp.]